MKCLEHIHFIVFHCAERRRQALQNIFLPFFFSAVVQWQPYYRALVKGAPFTQKLHLIYLVNDVLHHW